MSKNTVLIILSATTAFFIGCCGSIAVVTTAAGDGLTWRVFWASCVVGAFQAAKDVRSMLHMPPLTSYSSASTTAS